MSAFDGSPDDDTLRAPPTEMEMLDVFGELDTSIVPIVNEPELLATASALLGFVLTRVRLLVALIINAVGAEIVPSARMLDVKLIAVPLRLVVATNVSGPDGELSVSWLGVPLIAELFSTVIPP